jgi:DNA-binding GntR family transcriptional regulator
MQPLNEQTKILRRSLHDEVGEILREWIIRGHLPPDIRIQEARLTKDLGVSRTPVREALRALEQEGFVNSRLNRGFTVAPMDTQAVRDLYPVVGVLEGLAVKTSAAALQPYCAELRMINDHIRSGVEPAKDQYLSDLNWHSLLWRHCPNKRLVKLIGSLKQQVRRFDGAWKRGVSNTSDSCDQHAEIIVAIERTQYERAASLLETHWHLGMQVVLNWLAANAGKTATTAVDRSS